MTIEQCQICGQTPPPGHRFCDNCWPEKAIESGLASRCAVCGVPKMLAKLTQTSDDRLVCSNHSDDELAIRDPGGATY